MGLGAVGGPDADSAADAPARTPAQLAAAGPNSRDGRSGGDVVQ